MGKLNKHVLPVCTKDLKKGQQEEALQHPVEI